MRSRMLWVVLAALVIALVAATAGFAATRSASTVMKAPRTTARAGACGALMRDPAARKDMQALRTEHLADMRAWLDTYGSNPATPEAQAALAKLRAEHWNDMRALLKKYGIATGNPSRGGMMGGCAGGGCAGGGMMGDSTAGGYGGMMGTY